MHIILLLDAHKKRRWPNYSHTIKRLQRWWRNRGPYSCFQDSRWWAMVDGDDMDGGWYGDGGAPPPSLPPSAHHHLNPWGLSVPRR
jgi:hypothetical protein